MRAFATRFASIRGGHLDPLLTAARVLLFSLLAGVILAMVLSVIGLVVYVTSRLSELFLLANWAIWRPVVAHVLGLVALGLVSSSIQSLLAMIGAVERRDPFHDGNGKGLEKIAGNLLGLQLLGLLAALIGLPVGGDINGFGIHLKLSPGGVAVVLLLFILARVFRQGAAMRDDLDGTV